MDKKDLDNIMETDLFKQLDLAVYTQTHVAWWQQPVAQGLFGLLLCVLVGVVIVFMRRRKRKKKSTVYVQQLLDILYDSVQQWQQKKLTATELFSLLTMLIRRYSWFCIGDSTVVGMTDQEWLSFTRSHEIFRSVGEECTNLVEALARCKFCESSGQGDNVLYLCELVYQIIAKTSFGAISQVSGIYYVGSKKATA